MAGRRIWNLRGRTRLAALLLAWSMLVVMVAFGCVAKQPEFPPHLRGTLVFESGSQLEELHLPGGTLSDVVVTQDSEILKGRFEAPSRCRTRATVFVEFMGDQHQATGRFLEIDLKGVVRAEYPHKQKPRVSPDCRNVAYQYRRQLAIGHLDEQEPTVVLSAVVPSVTRAIWLDNERVVFQDEGGSVLIADAVSGETKEVFPSGNWVLACGDGDRLILFDSKEFSIWFADLTTGRLEKKSQATVGSKRKPVIAIAGGKWLAYSRGRMYWEWYDYVLRDMETWEEWAILPSRRLWGAVWFPER